MGDLYDEDFALWTEQQTTLLRRRAAGELINAQNWRGKPLVSYQTIVQLIAATTTRAGLNVKAEIDNGTYPSGIKVTDAEMATLNISPRIPWRVELHDRAHRLGNVAFIYRQTLTRECRVLGYFLTARDVRS